MKVTTFVEFSQEVDVLIGFEDVRVALSEAYSAATGAEAGDKRTVVTALAQLCSFLSALTDEQIDLMTWEQKALFADRLSGAAGRFVGGLNRP